MKLILTGATGLSGAEVLKQALNDKDIERITVLTRKSVDQSHPKLNEIILKDFTDYSGVVDKISDHDACIWALGISQNAVGKEEYIKITEDYTMAAAKCFFKANPNMRFLFLSGQGADQKEKSFTLFGNVKGRTERRLLEMNNQNVFNFRPAYIQPSAPRANPRILESVIAPIVPLINTMTDGFSVPSAQLARCMIGVAKHSNSMHLFDNKAIKYYKE
jgi:uncharacterized protein YbjT (DUF2867 family)